MSVTCDTTNLMNHFVIIGAQRAATTYLYQVLNEHPQIQMALPVRPEPKYFLREAPLLSYKEYVSTYFKDYSDKVLTLGEKSTSYYEYKEVAHRIKAILPKSKIIISMCDPVQRALSNYFFSVSNNLETRSLAEAFIHKKPAPSYSSSISTNPFNYLGRGMYHQHIKPYLKIFGRENMLFTYREVFAGNAKSIQAIYKFLGVDASFVPPSLSERINESERNSQVPTEVVAYLTEYYRPYVSELEELLEEEVPWH